MRTYFKSPLMLAAMALVFSLTTSSYGAFDAFLKLDGIEGESTDETHRGEIEIESFSWGATNTGAHAGGGGGGAGKVSMQDFHFVCPISKASPQLMLKCCQGTHIKQAILTCRKAGGRQETYLEYKLTDVLVSSYSSAGTTSGDTVPTDQISLNFTKIEYRVMSVDPATGQATATSAWWDLKTAKGGLY